MKVVVRLNRRRTSGAVLVQRERGDPRLPATWAGEHRLLHMLKRTLNAAGWDVIKKRMSKDGHLTDDERPYLRSRVVRKGRPVVAIHHGDYMLRSAAEDFSRGEYVRLDVVNIGCGLMAQPRTTR